MFSLASARASRRWSGARARAVSGTEVVSRGGERTAEMEGRTLAVIASELDKEANRGRDTPIVDRRGPIDNVHEQVGCHGRYGRP